MDSEEEPDEEPSPFAHLGEDRPRLCQQRVPLVVNGNLTSLHTLYNWESPNTLVRIESARRISLQGVRAPRQAIKGYQGVGTITDSVYYLPLLDVDGNIQVIRAHGVDEIAVVAHTRLPPIAREIFPVIRQSWAQNHYFVNSYLYQLTVSVNSLITATFWKVRVTK